MQTNNIFVELSKFNDIKFYDEPHVYFIKDKQVVSVTGFIGAFANEFEEQYWLERTALKVMKKDGIEDTPENLKRAMEKLKAEWVFKNKHGRYEGTMVHSYLEGLMANKEVAEDRSFSYEGLKFEDIEDTFFMMKRLAKRFYDEYIVTGKLIPVRSELVVGNYDIGLAGQIDQIFYNTEEDCLQVYDWKTNGKLERASKNCSMKHCLNHLDSCEYTKYSLQLSAYRYLLEKTTNIRVSKEAFIVWMNERNPKAEVIPATDYTPEIEAMIEFKKQNPDMFPVRPYTRPSMPEAKIPTAIAMDDLLSF
jgi:hypothetical protein